MYLGAHWLQAGSTLTAEPDVCLLSSLRYPIMSTYTYVCGILPKMPRIFNAMLRGEVVRDAAMGRGRTGWANSPAGCGRISDTEDT